MSEPKMIEFHFSEMVEAKLVKPFPARWFTQDAVQSYFVIGTRFEENNQRVLDAVAALHRQRRGKK